MAGASRRSWRRHTAAYTVAAGLVAVLAMAPLLGMLRPVSKPQTPQEEYAREAVAYLELGYFAEGPEWDEARTRILDAAKGTSSYTPIQNAVALNIGAAGGKHSRYLGPAPSAPDDDATPSPGQDTGDPADDATAPILPTVTVKKQVASIKVPAMPGGDPEATRRYAHTGSRALNDAKSDVCGWIVDVRGNTGGGMHPMLGAVAPLLPRGILFHAVDRDGTTGEFTLENDGIHAGGTLAVDVATTHIAEGMPVAVLQDRNVASAGEMTLTAFRGLDNVESFGRPSMGLSSMNNVFVLSDGARLVLTTAMVVDRDGNSSEEQPIMPDHNVEDAESAAREWLRTQGCG